MLYDLLMQMSCANVLDFAILFRAAQQDVCHALCIMAERLIDKEKS